MEASLRTPGAVDGKPTFQDRETEDLAEEEDGYPEGPAHLPVASVRLRTIRVPGQRLCQEQSRSAVFPGPSWGESWGASNPQWTPKRLLLYLTQYPSTPPLPSRSPPLLKPPLACLPNEINVVSSLSSP